jgi:DNA-binding GntR family transcriptional regulator
MTACRRSSSNSDHGKVYRWLKTMLVEYRFHPGEQLLIGPLAERLRVSATPVRETLIRLHAEGLLDTTHKRGFYARTLNLKEMIELSELRFTLLRRAIENHADPSSAPVDSTPSGPAIVEATIVPGIDAIGAPTQMARRCAIFLEQAYEWLISFAQNDVMGDIIRNLNDRTHYVRMIDLEAPERMNNALSTVDEIFVAVQRHELATASAALKRELEAQIDLMPTLVKEGIGRAYTSLDVGMEPSDYPERQDSTPNNGSSRSDEFLPSRRPDDALSVQQAAKLEMLRRSYRRPA